MRPSISPIDAVSRHPSMPAWSVVALLSIAVVSGCTATGSVEDPSRLEFVSHATFFSAASGRPDVIDPQVFVASPGAPAATGLQDIAHVENVSYASPSAALATRLLTATGRPLELTVGDWYFARGSVTFNAQPGGTKTTPEEAVEGESKENIAVVPLAIPLLTGPGTISTVIIYSDKAEHFVQRLSLIGSGIVIALLTFVALSSADPISRVLGRTGINVATRLMGLMLAALGVELIVDGLVALIPALRH